MKAFAALTLLIASGAAKAETKYRALYFNGNPISYATQERKADKLDGKPAIKTTLRWHSRMNVGGQFVKADTSTVAWSTKDNRPLRLTVITDNPGSRTKFEAIYGKTTVEVNLEKDGKRTHHSVPIPEGKLVDSVEKAIHDELSAGGSLTYWSLNSVGTAFDKWELKALGSADADLNGKKVPALLTELRSEGTVFKLYTSPEGELLRQEYPFGVLDLSVPKETALALSKKPAPEDDFLVANSLKMEGSLGDLERLYNLKLRIVGMDLSTIPSDDAQTVTKDGDGWIVELHPTSEEPALRLNLPRAEVAKGKEEWLKPSPYLSVDDPKIVKTAKEVVDGWPRFDWLTLSIQQYVWDKMKYEIGFGDTRDAVEILRKPKGQCTDYAILTTALLRAAGVPARMVCGLIPADERSFYYHAWSEAWDGLEWVTVDSLADAGHLPAYYIKLAQGGVQEAFNYPIPSDPKAVKIKVLQVN